MRRLHVPSKADRICFENSSGIVANDRDVARRWLSARALGKDVFNFIIEAKGASPEQGPVVGIMGSYHWPEVGYLIHPGKSDPVECHSFFLNHEQEVHS